ncbi:MAG: YbfB/YjiJ family MFS transporter [Burkholderiales bacterium]|nr:YbfB/YjiJ family MFS transporter [Burkholderiales bacterium]
MATAARPVTTLALCIAGALSLAVAMGIGRFAFTPLLPLMIREGQLDVAAGGWVAAANYLGYFAGALTAGRLPWRATHLAMLGLLATAVLTAAMAAPGPWLWGAWRFLAGMASAWVFVATAVWCLGALAQAGKPQAAGYVYAGVGAGIALAGLHGWAAGAAGVTPSNLWLQLALLALVLSIPIALVLRRSPAPAAAPATAAASPSSVSKGLVLAYGVMGFGYILPATFLPVLARNVIDDPFWFGLAWPVFGAVAALSTIVASWWLHRRPRTEVWAVCQALMGVGTLLPSLWPHGLAILLSALLVGGTFMIVTLAGVQEARARTPGDPRAAVGRMTAAFAIGQIAGPVVSALLLHVPALRAHGLAIALQLAALSLFATAAWLWREARTPPLQTETSHAR